MWTLLSAFSHHPTTTHRFPISSFSALQVLVAFEITKRKNESEKKLWNEKSEMEASQEIPIFTIFIVFQCGLSSRSLMELVRLLASLSLFPSLRDLHLYVGITFFSPLAQTHTLPLTAAPPNVLKNVINVDFCGVSFWASWNMFNGVC